MKTDVISHKNSSIETLIEETSSRIKDDAITQSKDIALVNKPAKNEPLEGYTSQLTSAFDTLASKVASMAGLETLQTRYRTAKGRVQEKEEKLKEEITILKNKIPRQKSTVEKIGIEPILVKRKIWAFIFPAILLLLGSEIIVNEASFSKISSGGQHFRLIIGLGTSASYMLIIWGIFSIIQKIENRFSKYTLITLLLAIVFVGTWTLGEMRYEYELEVEGNSSPVYLFVGLSLLIFTASLIGKLVFSPTWNERATYRLYSRLLKELKQMESELSSKESEHEVLIVQWDQEKSEFESLYSMGMYYIDLVEKLHTEVLSAYINTSNQHRTDGAVLSFENYNNGVPKLSIASFTLNSES